MGHLLSSRCSSVEVDRTTHHLAVVRRRRLWLQVVVARRFRRLSWFYRYFPS